MKYYCQKVIRSLLWIVILLGISTLLNMLGVFENIYRGYFWIHLIVLIFASFVVFLDASLKKNKIKKIATFIALILGIIMVLISLGLASLMNIDFALVYLVLSFIICFAQSPDKPKE